MRARQVPALLGFPDSGSEMVPEVWLDAVLCTRPLKSHSTVAGPEENTATPHTASTPHSTGRQGSAATTPTSLHLPPPPAYLHPPRNIA
jgi:hypothetical protein